MIDIVAIHADSSFDAVAPSSDCEIGFGSLDLDYDCDCDWVNAFRGVASAI